MTQRTINVLRINSVEEQERYRRAVAHIILNIQKDYSRTHIEIAEDIDVSVGTISNAANRKADLSAVYLQRLGQVYGPSYLDPYFALFGGRAVPIEAEEADALPPLSAVVHQIAAARSSDSPGGIAITHSELLAMLPDLRAAQRCLAAMIVKAERIAA